MKIKCNMILLVLICLLFHINCFQSGDRFTSAEIAIPFKTLNEKETVVLKTNILGNKKIVQ